MREKVRSKETETFVVAYLKSGAVVRIVFVGA